MDINFNRNNFLDYDDLLDEVYRVILIYVNDLIKFHDLLNEGYFENLIELENILLINNLIVGGQRIKSTNIDNLCFKLSDILSKTIALKDSTRKISSITFKELRYTAAIRALKGKALK